MLSKQKGIEQSINRIGRLQFFFEILFATVLLKVSIQNIDGLVLPVLLTTLGATLTIWAYIRRLRDLKFSSTSIWLIIILPLVVILFSTLSSVFLQIDVTNNIFSKIVINIFAVACIGFIVVLLLKPSAYPRIIKPKAGVNESSINIDKLQETEISTKSNTRIRLSGYQRIGIILSTLWCIGIVANAINDYYIAVNNNDAIARCCDEDKTRNSWDDRRIVTFCEIRDLCKTGISMPTIPNWFSIFIMIFIPIAAGWIVVYAINFLIKWVKEGFKIRT